MSMNRYIYDKVNRLIKKYKTRDPIELIEALNINLVYLPETKILLGMISTWNKNTFRNVPLYSKEQIYFYQ